MMDWWLDIEGFARFIFTRSIHLTFDYTNTKVDAPLAKGSVEIEILKITSDCCKVIHLSFSCMWSGLHTTHSELLQNLGDNSKTYLSFILLLSLLISLSNVCEIKRNLLCKQLDSILQHSQQKPHPESHQWLEGLLQTNRNRVPREMTTIVHILGNCLLN